MSGIDQGMMPEHVKPQRADGDADGDPDATADAEKRTAAAEKDAEDKENTTSPFREEGDE